MATITERLDDLVINQDILAVRITKEMMIKGKPSPGRCAGVLAIAKELGRDDMKGIKITVGHRTKEHLSDRVVIKVVEEPNAKWISWIIISPSKSGFHPKQFDQGKQRSPGAMVLESWSKETVQQMPIERQMLLHSPSYREQNKEYLATTPKNGGYRVYGN